MAEWIKVIEENSFSGSRSVSCRGHPVALFKLEDDIYAIDDICSHEEARLSDGEVEGEEVLCPKHGSRFNIKSGAVMGLPAVKPVRSYPVKVENGGVYIQWS
jgi:3-phenylpropionate/trans-cinnamate dioxygenase ferredoxin subunit